MRGVVRLEQWENLILRRKINLDKRRLVFSEIKQAFGEEEKAYCIFFWKAYKALFFVAADYLISHSYLADDFLILRASLCAT